MCAALAKEGDNTVVTLKRAAGHRKKAAAVYRRLNIKAQKAQGSGLRLLQVINRVMATKGHDLGDVAESVGISEVYLRAIGNGRRKFSDVDKDVLRNIAQYVNLPVAQVFLLSDTLVATDFFYEEKIESELDLAFQSMTSHPMWAGYAPSTEEWDSMSQRQKLFTCMLYERNTNQQFLSSASVETPVEK